jgi:hypothetical protein
MVARACTIPERLCATPQSSIIRLDVAGPAAPAAPPTTPAPPDMSMFSAKNTAPSGVSTQPMNQPIWGSASKAQPVLPCSAKPGPRSVGTCPIGACSIRSRSFTRCWCATSNGNASRRSRCRNAICSTAEIARPPSSQKRSMPPAMLRLP